MKIKLSPKTALVCFVALSLTFAIFTVNRKVIKMRKIFQHQLKKHKTNLRAKEFTFYKLFQNKYTFPKELKNVPLMRNDVILGVKEIEIRNVFAPYNASIIEQDKGYLMFFRYDLVHQMYYNKIHSFIGCAELDEELNQAEKEFAKVNTNSNYSEDPRVIQSGESYYLIYNDLFRTKEKKRGMHLAQLDLCTRQLKSIVPMDLKMNRVEKNWTPFAFKGSNQEPKLCFEYQVSHPRKILTMDNFENPLYIGISQKKDLLENIPWKWGVPSGGTPARMIDGEYLAFFHSKFVDKNGIWWYVMGAYTFEPNPPFRITRVSPYPILFDGIYDSEYKNTAEPCKCIIFPCGYAVKEKNGQVILQLACGENDSAIKVVTFDKDTLLESLVSVNEP